MNDAASRVATILSLQIEEVAQQIDYHRKALANLEDKLTWLRGDRFHMPQLECGYYHCPYGITVADKKESPCTSA